MFSKGLLKIASWEYEFPGKPTPCLVECVIGVPRRDVGACGKGVRLMAGVEGGSLIETIRHSGLMGRATGRHTCPRHRRAAGTVSSLGSTPNNSLSVEAWELGGGKF